LIKIDAHMLLTCHKQEGLVQIQSSKLWLTLRHAERLPIVAFSQLMNEDGSSPGLWAHRQEIVAFDLPSGISHVFVRACTQTEPEICA
jgi:hypothetical protein